MTISQIGEFGLIKRFALHFNSQLSRGFLGIGDDCAVIPFSQNEHSQLLVTTDMLVEEIHFLKKIISPQDLGHKSLAVSLSDIAAMGGAPLYAFLSLSLPSNLSVEWVDAFFKGFGALAKDYDVQLLGGDTTRSSGPIVINVVVMGKAHASSYKLRSSAKVGDRICVTGFLGDSTAGLKAILERNTTENELSNSENLDGSSNSVICRHGNSMHASKSVGAGVNWDQKRRSGGPMVHCQKP